MKYIKAWSTQWERGIPKTVIQAITEKPLLNACSGNVFFGDVRVDAYHPWPDVRADVRALPFKNDSFAAVFLDPPWNHGFKHNIGLMMNEAIRVAPVVYLMAPFTWGSSKATMKDVWVRWSPGVQTPVILSRYERNA